MLKSMTAFGRTTLTNPNGCFTVELQTVNRKHLEINVFIPRELLRFEVDIRKWISSAISRGQVTLKLSALFNNASPLNAKPNLPLARQLKHAWDKIAEDLGLPPEKGFSLDMLSEERDIILYEDNLQDETVFKNDLQNAVTMALDKLMQMKLIEGAALHKDIAQRLQKLRALIQPIHALAPTATTKYRQKLVERLNELLSGHIENEERILREVGIYAEKIDIAEELTRLDSHLQQFGDLIEYSEDSIGKTLDFLLQEMNREINTIGSKSSELEISQIVVEAKSELERIREQIQNIE